MKVIFFSNEEIWADINYGDIKPDLYQVSNMGRIRNKVRNKLLALSLGYEDYVRVPLQNINGDRPSYSVHILVAWHFIPNPDPYNKIFVNHKDLCRANNAVTNLEWVTPQENSIHAAENDARNVSYKKLYDTIMPGYIKGKSNWSHGEVTAGQNNGMSEWTNNQVHKICQGLEQGMNYGDALIFAGLENTENNRFNVSHIAQGVRWKTISQQYNIPPARKQIEYAIYAEDVCRCIQDGMKTGEIIKTLNLPGTYEQCRGFIGRIKRRENYTDISCNYKW